MAEVIMVISGKPSFCYFYPAFWFAKIAARINFRMEPIDKHDKSIKDAIFLKRADGLGWTLNFDRRASYLFLITFIVLLILGILWGSGVF